MFVQVNGKRMNDCSHEEAALALKGAGSTVTLLVEYRPNEFAEFQQRLQQLQELQATSSVEPSNSPGIKPPPVKQLYVRCVTFNTQCKQLKYASLSLELCLIMIQIPTMTVLRMAYPLNMGISFMC